VNTFAVVRARAADILRTEGFTPLLRRSLSRVAQRFLHHESCYLYELALVDRDEADFRPRADNYTLKVFRSGEEADDWAAAAGFDFRERHLGAANKLEGGAIAFCAFIGRQLAHIGWVAMSPEAKAAMRQAPYRVDFPNGEACTGGMWTDPRYRRLGLARYVYFKRCQFLRDNGKAVSRNAVRVDNVAGQGVMERFGARIYAKGRILRVLGWSNWNEKPWYEARR
jgi:GNAT superfamily N-acetyltransferase